MFDALFNFAHASQILVEFLPVPRSKLTLQGAGIIEHKVQDASLLFLTALEALFAFTGCASAKESLEQQAGIRLGRHGLAGRAPGQSVLIGARISGIAIAGFAHRVAGQFQGRKPGEMPDLVGCNLVDGNARVNVRAGGFLDADAGQEGATGARVVTGAVRAGRGVDVVQLAQDLQAFFDVLQRLHRAVEFKILALASRPPVAGDRTIREIDKGHPQRRAGRRSRQRTGRVRIGRERSEWPERLEGGQRQTRAETAEEMAPAQTGESLSGNVLVKRRVCFHGCSLAWTPFSKDCAGLASVTVERFRRF